MPRGWNYFPSIVLLNWCECALYSWHLELNCCEIFLEGQEKVWFCDIHLCQRTGKRGYLHSVCKYQYTEDHIKLQGWRAWHRRGICVILVKEGTNKGWGHSDEIFNEYLMSTDHGRAGRSWSISLSKCDPCVDNLILILSISLSDQRAGQSRFDIKCKNKNLKFAINYGFNIANTSCTAKHRG